METDFCLTVCAWSLRRHSDNWRFKECSQMIYNDVTQTVLDDELILQYGELFFE